MEFKHFCWFSHFFNHHHTIHYSIIGIVLLRNRQRSSILSPPTSSFFTFTIIINSLTSRRTASPTDWQRPIEFLQASSILPRYNLNRNSIFLPYFYHFDMIFSDNSSNSWATLIFSIIPFIVTFGFLFTYYFLFEVFVVSATYVSCCVMEPFLIVSFYRSPQENVRGRCLCVLGRRL